MEILVFYLSISSSPPHSGRPMSRRVALGASAAGALPSLGSLSIGVKLRAVQDVGVYLTKEANFPESSIGNDGVGLLLKEAYPRVREDTRSFYNTIAKLMKLLKPEIHKNVEWSTVKTAIEEHISMNKTYYAKYLVWAMGDEYSSVTSYLAKRSGTDSAADDVYIHAAAQLYSVAIVVWGKKDSSYEVEAVAVPNKYFKNKRRLIFDREAAAAGVEVDLSYIVNRSKEPDIPAAMEGYTPRTVHVLAEKIDDTKYKNYTWMYDANAVIDWVLEVADSGDYETAERKNVVSAVASYEGEYPKGPGRRVLWKFTKKVGKMPGVKTNDPYLLWEYALEQVFARPTDSATNKEWLKTLDVWNKNTSTDLPYESSGDEEASVIGRIRAMDNRIDDIEELRQILLKEVLPVVRSGHMTLEQAEQTDAYKTAEEVFYNWAINLDDAALEADNEMKDMFSQIFLASQKAEREKKENEATIEAKKQRDREQSEAQELEEQRRERTEREAAEKEQEAALVEEQSKRKEREDRSSLLAARRKVGRGMLKKYIERREKREGLVLLAQASSS